MTWQILLRSLKQRNLKKEFFRIKWIIHIFVTQVLFSLPLNRSVFSLAFLTQAKDIIMLSFFYRDSALSKFLQSPQTKSCILRKGDTRQATHYSLDGGKVFVDPSEQETFIEHYIQQVSGQNKAFLCEVIGPKPTTLVRFFMEFDTPQNMAVEPKTFCNRVTPIIAEVLVRLFDLPSPTLCNKERQLSLYWLTPSTYPDHCGYHLHIPGCIVEVQVLKQLTDLLTNILETKLPTSTIGLLATTPWSSIIDTSVCRLHSSIRLPYSYKADKCPCIEKPCMQCEMRHYVCREDKGYYKPFLYMQYDIGKAEMESIAEDRTISKDMQQLLSHITPTIKQDDFNTTTLLNNILVSHVSQTQHRKSNLIYLDHVTISADSVPPTEEIPWPLQRQKQMFADTVRKSKIFTLSPQLQDSKNENVIDLLLNLIFSYTDAQDRTLPLQTLSTLQWPSNDDSLQQTYKLLQASLTSVQESVKYKCKKQSDFLMPSIKSKWYNCKSTSVDILLYDYFPYEMTQMWTGPDQDNNGKRNRNKRFYNYDDETVDLFSKYMINKRAALEIVIALRSVQGAFGKHPEAFCPYRKLGVVKTQQRDSDYHQTNHTSFRICIPVNYHKKEKKTEEDMYLDLATFFDRLLLSPSNSRNYLYIMHDCGHVTCRAHRKENKALSLTALTHYESKILAYAVILPLLQSKCTYNKLCKEWDFGSVKLGTDDAKAKISQLSQQKKQKIQSLFA